MTDAAMVSLDDSEAMLLSQAGLDGNDDETCLVEMGGHAVANETHMVTETAIRGFYRISGRLARSRTSLTPAPPVAQRRHRTNARRVTLALT